MGKYLDLAEALKRRDDDAISEFNNNMFYCGQSTTLERRLAFVEDRLTDTLGVLYMLIKDLDEKIK
jgi:hypothetical protein